MINMRIFTNLISNLRAGKAFEPQTRYVSRSRSVAGTPAAEARIAFCKRMRAKIAECKYRSQESEVRISELRSQKSEVKSREPGLLFALALSQCVSFAPIRSPKGQNSLAPGFTLD
jgi:hypothetical protein